MLSATVPRTTIDQPRQAGGAASCVPLVELLAGPPTEWEELRQDSPAASPFASWAWHRAWAESAPPEELRASYGVVLRNAHGALDALLPVAVGVVPFRRRRVPALTWAVGDVGCPDHLDVLARPGALLEDAIPTLLALPWDVAILSNLAPHAPNAVRLAAALARAGCAVRWNAGARCPYLELPGGWEEYLASMSANRRQALRRRERTLEREHAVVVTDYDAEHLAAGWHHLVALHEQRWTTAQGGGGTFSDPRVERLQRVFAEDLARRGQLWLTTLDIDGTPVAAWYGFAERDTVYFYQSGRDPRWKDKSVGVALMMNMIRRAIERGYRRFDFLRGDEPYKREWTAAGAMAQELVAFRPSWRGHWLRGLDLAARARARLRKTS
ncbi:MAG TPA: GNAT family N-acetyltransferase [Gemmatimonadales bacterium]|nr:GNAT family N-acetyltransferase [Gemmatimonadales bacterium]